MFKHEHKNCPAVLRCYKLYGFIEYECNPIHYLNVWFSGITCDYKGRPLHYMFYTLKPQYYELMHVSKSTSGIKLWAILVLHLALAQSFCSGLHTYWSWKNMLLPIPGHYCLYYQSLYLQLLMTPVHGSTAHFFGIQNGTRRDVIRQLIHCLYRKNKTSGLSSY